MDVFALEPRATNLEIGSVTVPDHAIRVVVCHTTTERSDDMWKIPGVAFYSIEVSQADCQIVALDFVLCDLK